MSATQLRAQQIKIGDGLSNDASNNVIVNIGSSGGLEFATGVLQINLDGTTLGLSSSGIKIADNGVGKDQLGIITTKGDLIAFDTEPVRIAVGSDGTYLIADAASTGGIKWQAFSGVATTNFVFNETPSGSIDGSNVTFTLANTPTIGTVSVYLNGVLQLAGSGKDYTISSGTITYLTAPVTGDIIRASYLK